METTPNPRIDWQHALVGWLSQRGYHLREWGQHNPATGRGWYSDPCEYQREHVRVRINPGGIVVLRDPGCTIQVTRPASGCMHEQWSPNAARLDVFPPAGPILDRAIRAIEAFEARPAYTAAEAQAAYR